MHNKKFNPKVWQIKKGATNTDNIKTQVIPKKNAFINH
jgi:hypothetical protein